MRYYTKYWAFIARYGRLAHILSICALDVGLALAVSFPYLTGVDIYRMLGFGVLGYFMKTYGFQVGPVILGIIVGPLTEVSYRRAMISTGDDPLSFVGELFTSPISAILTAAPALTILSQTTLWGRLTGRRPGVGATG